MGRDHRNPNARKPQQPVTGNERRGNKDAAEQARQNLKTTLEKTKDKVIESAKTINNIGTKGGSKPSTPSSNKPVIVNNVPKHKQGVSPVQQEQRQNTSNTFSYSFNSHRNTEQTNYFKIKQKEKEEKKLYEQSLEGQIDKEIEKVTTTGQNTKKYNMYSTLLNSYWNDYVYNVDPEEFKTWYDNNVVLVKRMNIETGQMEEVPTFKDGAPPPPLGTDKDGNTVDITKAWQYCQAYDVAINKYIEDQNLAEKTGRATKYAGQDPTSVDSLLDVFRAAVNPDESGAEAFKNYVRDYMWNPLVNGDYKALGINTLWNLGETLDYFGVGTRAAAASNDVIGKDARYSIDGASEPTFEGQNVWFYDDNKHWEQTRLVELGADKLLRGTARSESSYDTGGKHRNTNGESKEAIEAKIKDAGLWDEYIAMKEAWGKHQQEFREENKLLQNIKSAYTDPAANFHADTGNLAKDIAIEVVLDPTLMLGGAARGFAKTSARSTSEIAARTIVKTFATETISKEGVASAEKAIKQFVKRNSDNLLTKNHKQITDDIKRLGDHLERNGAIIRSTEDGARTFDDELSKEIFASIDSLNYKVVRSVHTASELMDKADSTMLKAVFAAPYVPISGAIKGYRGARTELNRLITTAAHREELFGEAVPWLPRRINNVLDNVAKRNQLDEIIARNQFGKIQSRARTLESKTLSDYEKFYETAKQQPSSEIWDDADVFIQSAHDLINAMNRPLADFRDGRLTAAQFGEAVDNQIASISGVATTRSELKAYFEELYQKAPEGDYGRVGKIYNDVMEQIRQVESIEKQMLDREVESFTKELKGIKNVQDLMEFSERYFIRNSEQALPEAFENALLAKQMELGGSISPEEFDTVLRNLERNQNFSIDLNPKDADIPLPASVKESKGFSTSIPLDVHGKVEDLKKYFTKEKHDWSGLSSVRSYMFAIKNVDDMPPRALHDVLRKGIVQLMLRKNMGAVIDDALYSKMIEIDRSLYDNALSIENVIGRDVDYNAIHLDHLTVFDEYMKHPRFRKVLETLRDPNTAIGKALGDVKRMHLTSAELEENPVYELIMQINDLLDMNSAYSQFRNTISSDVAGLTDRQVYAVIDRLFGITKGSPKDYLNKALTQPEKFMQDLETLLVAEYGQVRCSLDGARTQINTFDDELFKDYLDDIADPDIQKRLNNIAQPGHIDPMNDVRVQMLYTILRDKTTIKDYNALQANEREVIFSDIETSGLNKDYNGLTSIAFKKWIPIDENASLSDILDVIESKSSETLYKRSLSDDELKRIDDGLLKGLFAKDPKMANKSREDMLEAYKKFYAEEADGTKIFSSEEDMMKFINQYITDSSVIKEQGGVFGRKTIVKERAVPCLVFHNANGFDTKFLTARMRNLQVGIPRGAVKHLTDIEKYSHNTLARLRALEDDVILTNEQKEFVQDQVITLARSVEQYDNGFKFLDPRALEIALYDLQKLCSSKTNDTLFQSIGDKNTVKPVNTSIDKYPKDSLQAKLGLPNSDKFTDDLLKELDSSEFMKVRNDLKIACQDVGHMQNRYEKHIVQKVTSLDDDFATTKTYSNLMREAQETVPDRPWSYLSYDVLFRGRNASKYFDWNIAEKVTIDELHNMKKLTDWVDHKMQYNLRAGADAIIEPYEEFFRDIIDTAINFVRDVDTFNEYSYLRFLKQPSTPMEAYLVAQKLYDDVLKYTDPNKYSKDMKELLKKTYLSGDNSSLFQINMSDFSEYMKVQYMMRDGVLASDVEQPSAEALGILTGKCFRAQIFNDVIGDVPHYIDSLRTPQQRAVTEIKELRHYLDRRSSSFAEQSSFLSSSDFASIKTSKIQTAFDNVNNILSTFEAYETSRMFWKAYIPFRKVLNAKRMELFDAYRLNRMLRDSEGKVASDEQLISEILFTNGLRKVIPRSGNELHVTQVNELITRIEKMNSDKIIMHEEGDHIVLSINPEIKPLFSKDDDGVMVARFPDSPIEYRLMEEEKIGFPSFEELIEDEEIKAALRGAEYEDLMDSHLGLESIYNDLQKVYDDLDDITDGASRGTLGITATYNKEIKLASSFTTKTIRETLRTDFTGDSRIWGHNSFDKSLLGDFDNSYKLGSVPEDYDLLFNVVNALDDASGRVMSERHYIDTFFGDRSPCKFSDLSRNFSNEELVDIFRNSDEFVCVSLHEANTQTGFEVRQMKINDTLSAELAKRNGAIYIPYDLYLNMTDVINTSEISNKLLKYWSKFAAALKVTQLVHPGTWIRNLIDATYKVAADDSSLGRALSYEFIAAKRLYYAQKIINEVGTDVTEATWKAGNYDKYMTYDDFTDLLGFKANDTVSGGEAARSKRIIKEYFERGKRDEALGINGFDTIGKDVQRFEQAYDEQTLNTLLDKSLVSDPDLFELMTREDFIAFFNTRKLQNAFEFSDDTNRWAYNKIATEVIDTATNNIRHPLKTAQRGFDKITGGLLTPMSQVEQVVRYSQLLALRDLGYTNASAYKHIVDTHFNYNNKSLRMKCLEAVIPFATFQYNNLLYWIRQIDQNPRMIRWIDRTFGEASFAGIDDVEVENEIPYAERGQDHTANVDRGSYVDQSLEYRIASGGIPLGSDGLYFKLNPSYLDAMNWFYGGPDDFLSKVSPPLRSLAKAGISTMGLDSYNIFKETQFSHSAEEWGYELAESIPGANYVAGFVRHYKDSQPWTRLDVPIQEALVFALPSLFGAVKAYDKSFTGDFEEWQKQLAEDGKWYDSQLGKVVDLSHKKYRENIGLNNPDLSWEDRKTLEFLSKGRLYDQNQGRFVTLDKYIKGGLNRDWDFSKEGEWEEYCRLKKRYLGLEYDLNTRSFVPHKSAGGLNSSNLDWDTICDLNEKQGIYWDANQNRFVEEKYLTTGGFNKDKMSFPELCAYQYAVRGKIWDAGKHEFVKVIDPIVTVKANNQYNDWHIFDNLGFEPTNITPDNATYMENGILRSLSGKYVLSNNQLSNDMIFKDVVEKYSYSNYSRRFGYHRGYYGGHSYEALPIVPRSKYRNKGSVYGPVSADRSAAQRMALSGYRSFNEYYNFQFNYNYHYRNPTKYHNLIKRYDYYRPNHQLLFNKFAMYAR